MAGVVSNSSVTRLGDFLKLLKNFFYSKVAQLFGDFWLFRKPLRFSEKLLRFFLRQLLEKFGPLSFLTSDHTVCKDLTRNPVNVLRFMYKTKLWRRLYQGTFDVNVIRRRVVVANVVATDTTPKFWILKKFEAKKFCRKVIKKLEQFSRSNAQKKYFTFWRKFLIWVEAMEITWFCGHVIYSQCDQVVL